MNLMVNGIEAMKDSGRDLTVKSHLQGGPMQTGRQRYAASGFSMYVPLEGATFNSFDLERGSGDSPFEETMRDAGFKFVWEIRLPDGMIVVLSDFVTALTPPWPGGVLF